ncbi:MAG: GntR family transcriptional regulator [Chitinivibrionales bacterium]|nr:GntR family transcriptional regulator [Chitinivibrionales bacterium]
MKGRTGAAYARALDYLTAAAHTPGRRLPTVDQLARAARVSRMTMHRAVRTLCERGRLRASPGTGIHVVSPRNATPLTAAPQRGGAPSRWERVRATLERDVARGRYLPGEPLPRYKTLSATYGATYRTLRKALTAMAVDGHVEEWHAGYRVPLRRAETPRNTIQLAVRGAESQDTIGTWAPRNQEQFQALARVCGMAGIDLDFVTYRYRGTRLADRHGRRRLALSASALHSVLGFMVWTQGLDELDLVPYVEHLLGLDRPVAVLDVSGLDLYPLLRTGSMARVFALGTDARCGVLAGQFLLGLGHRKVAYITQSPSVTPRLTGLRRAFVPVGGESAVTCYRFTGIPVPARATTAPAVRLREKLDISDDFDRMVDQALRRHSERIQGMVDDEREFAHLSPLLERVLAESDASVWVAENDKTAVRCLEFLRENGVAVPGRLSLVGFDDTEEALLRGITSYNFNVAAIVQAMVDHLLHPQPYRPNRHGRAPTVIEGFVNARRTTARPALD